MIKINNKFSILHEGGYPKKNGSAPLPTPPPSSSPFHIAIIRFEIYQTSKKTKRICKYHGVPLHYGINQNMSYTTLLLLWTILTNIFVHVNLTTNWKNLYLFGAHADRRALARDIKWLVKHKKITHQSKCFKFCFYSQKWNQWPKSSILRHLTW